MRKYKLVLLIVLLFPAAGVYSQQLNNTRGSVTRHDLEEWINTLASDDMHGRMTGSDDSRRAADWIAGKYLEYGLTSFKNLDGYFQPYDVNRRGREISDRNVIGLVKGNDPELKNQYIVISAHFDHIGIRDAVDGDSIYNGADDNAAGVCALIGIAKNIKDRGLKPGRSLIFAAFSGEELGLVGSGYFVHNLPVPVTALYTDINFEMIGHSEFLGKGRYYMTGTGNTNLDEIISSFRANPPCILVDTISLADRLFYMSDNFSFARIRSRDNVSVGIPDATFATTTMADYIHTPRDEAGLFDFENMTGLVNYFSEIIISLSNYKGDVKWTTDRFVIPDSE